MLLNRILDAIPSRSYDSTAAYQRHLSKKLRQHPNDRDLAFAQVIGAETVELFNQQGDGQVAVLKYHGLANGMAVYDLGCGCGRTAQALRRAGWQGRYIGADVVGGLVTELKRKCPEFEAHVHRQPTIVAEDGSLDMIFHWSVFTHISPEECFLYVEDSFRALKPGGRLVFSFLELTEPNHYNAIFDNRVGRLRRERRLHLLDTFLHRDWIDLWAERVGFRDVEFTDGQDASKHPPMWQTLVAMAKPS
jgi:SAM-dependent methyltransferase